MELFTKIVTFCMWLEICQFKSFGGGEKKACFSYNFVFILAKKNISVLTIKKNFGSRFRVLTETLAKDFCHKKLRV